MKTLGHRSLATFLRVALRIVLILLYVAIPLTVLGCAVALMKSYGVDINWFDMPRPPSPLITWLFTALFAVSLAGTIIIVDQLRRIFATLSDGDPFVPENALHLRVIWMTLAVWELVRYALAGTMMATMIALRIEPPEGFENDPFNFSLGIWFAVLTVIVLAEVFREGARMRQEQKLTI